MKEPRSPALREWGFEAGQGLAVKSHQPLPDAAHVLEWWTGLLREYPDAKGWAQYSDMNVLVPGDPDARAPRPEGILLAGELCRGQTSHHLRLLESGWVGVTLERVADAESFLEFRELLGKEPARALKYEVAWSGTPLRPTTYRLARIE